MKGFLSVSLLFGVLLSVFVPKCAGQFRPGFFFGTTPRLRRTTTTTTTTPRPTATAATQRPTTTTTTTTTQRPTTTTTTTTTQRPTTRKPTTTPPLKSFASSGSTGGQAVGFSAGLLSPRRGLSKGDFILFNDVITNVGNGYNRNTGAFTCGVEGLYLFTVSITAFERHPVTVELGVNGERKMQVVVGSGLVSTSSSGTVALHLKQGDLVRVTNSNFIGHKIEAVGTAFSGVLIKPM